MKSSSHYLSTLKFWRAFESFNLPDLKEPRRNDGKELNRLYQYDELPWEKEKYFKSERGEKWKHTLFFCCLPKQQVIEIIKNQLSDRAEVIEPLGGNTWMSALIVDETGIPYNNTYTRASFSYAIKALLRGENFDNIGEELKQSHADYPVRFQISETEVLVDKEDLDEYNEEDEYDEEQEGEEEYDEEDDYNEGNSGPVTWDQLKKELDDLYQIAPELLTGELYITCISEKISSSAEPVPPFLNSFYTNDLTKLIDLLRENKQIGPSLNKYLQKDISNDQRYDLQKQIIMLQCLHPALQSASRWPSDPKHGLYSAQQAALNMTFNKLRDYDGLLGINGPPGTGKTTLLRDILADIVFNRAKRLLEHGAKKLFNRKRITIGATAYYDISAELVGNDGILISSNNNAAVENISMELPQLKNIDTDSFPDAAYFKDIAHVVNDKSPAWGMLSAVLGNADNCNKFRQKFWDKSGFSKRLDELGMNGTEKQFIDKFDSVAAELKILLNVFSSFQEIASAYHDGIMGKLYGKEFKKKIIRDRELEQLRIQLLTVYHILPENIIDERFAHMEMTTIHSLTPYSSPYINKIRSNIFLKSLELHQYAILANAKYFRANLDMFLNMLGGKNKTLINEDVTKALWDSFFFCVPVVSSSLASVERFLKKMGERSIGWLLLDEAGQATPQSACGAIWRTKRSIIIGDTLQVPPVVTMPEILGKVLQDYYKMPDHYWSPLYSSAQFLADRITDIGTSVPSKGEEIWTGIPLRAHRRCAKPMFSIANKIAYNEQMVKVTIDEPLDICLGESTWIDVKGKRKKGHVIEEEIAVLKKMVDQIFDANDLRTIYIISPFKSVASRCMDVFKKYEDVHCGTIHTFQGKEADIVFIVLGSDPAFPGARAWVAQAPNMLNVAVTRAKKYIYVIGNKQLWEEENYFDYLASSLPVKINRQ